MKKKPIFEYISVLSIFFLILIPNFTHASNFKVGFRGHHGHRNFSRRNYGYNNFGHRNYGYRNYGYNNFAYRNYRHNNFGKRLSFGHNYYSPSRNFSYINSAPYYKENSFSHKTSEAKDYDATQSVAWGMLHKDGNLTALNIFANEARRHPKNGVPKTGYAIAHASLGDLDKGVWAMRRAFRISPESLHYLNLDSQSSTVIDDLIQKYKNNLTHQKSDSAFMIASLNYLQHNYKTANEYIKIAASEGDTSASVINLQRLIDEQQ